MGRNGSLFFLFIIGVNVETGLCYANLLYALKLAISD